MAGALEVNENVVIPEAELVWRFSRSSGPGGQGVNTSDSRAQLRWDVVASRALTDDQREQVLRRLAHRLAGGVLVINASEYRSQRRNRDAAEQRLVRLVALALAPAPRARRDTRPTRGSVERRLAAKRRRSDVKKHRRDLGD